MSLTTRVRLLRDIQIWQRVPEFDYEYNFLDTFRFDNEYLSLTTSAPS